jgi:hypothetical protein
MLWKKKNGIDKNQIWSVTKRVEKFI